MAPEKVTEMVLNVDLQCDSCYKKVKKVLCKIPQIRDQVFDEKKNTVTITVVCCSPDRIADKLCYKGGKAIQSIEIKDDAPKAKEAEKPKAGKPKEQEKAKAQDKPKEADKPKAAEPEKPKSNGKGDKPKSDGKEDKPKSDGKAEKPKSDGKAEKPKSDGKGDKPKSDAKPAAEKSGEKPAKEAQKGDQPKPKDPEPTPNPPAALQMGSMRMPELVNGFPSAYQQTYPVNAYGWQCYDAYGGVPGNHGYGRPVPPPPGQFYDGSGYGYGPGGGRPCYVTRYDYFSDENAAGCSIM